jgi:hypothetical protein
MANLNEGKTMSEKQNTIPLRFENRVFIVAPDFILVREIENELGSISALRENFSRNGWLVSDLVALMQMLLQAAGKAVDYILLGNAMLHEGLAHYLSAARVFLDLVLHAE